MKKTDERIPFSDLCRACERISVKHKRDEKSKVLESFIENWRKFHITIYKDDKTAGVNDTFYPFMRLLLPQYERERGAYGIKEASLAKLYIEILCLGKESNSAQKLLNYRAPKTDAGDFASIVAIVLKNHLQASGNLTVAEVNKHLDNIAFSNSENNKVEVKKNLKTLLCNTTMQEQKWLIRMILKDMKMGLSDANILQKFHPDAKDLYDVTSSLVRVCGDLRDPSVRLHEIEISLFNPFRPMLSGKAKIDEVEKVMKNEMFYVETKLDGERVQIHKDGNNYKYFSRNGIEYTRVYGNSPLGGTLTPDIANLFKREVDSCILDGEMVGWNKILKCIGTKGQNFDVKTLTEDDPEFQPCFCAFDLLFYNGQVLSNQPLRDRLKILDTLFTPLDGKLMYTPRRESNTKQDVVDALNEAIERREEGIILKNPESVYKPNDRGCNWWKLKPEYVDDLMNELDLIILGGYFGDGKKRGGIVSHFLLGVAVNPKPGENPCTFHSFARVGSGYTLQELYHLLNKMKDHWKVYDKKKPPPNIILASGHKEKPDLWIEPEKSQIVQVKAAEIIGSDKFKTNCTLRFPRVEKVRYDKPWSQCLTLKELEDLRKEAEGKLATRFMGEDGQTSPKKRKIAQRFTQEKTLAPHFRPTDVSNIETISETFSGKEFCVLNGSASQSKADFEKIVTKLGGTFAQNPGDETFCIVSDSLNLRTRNLIKTGKYNVLKSDWLLQCEKEKKLVQWSPLDFWFCKEETKSKLSEDFDEFGDSYTEEITPEKLKLIFDNIPNQKWRECKPEITNEEIAKYEFKYFPNESSLSLFRTLKIYVDNKLNIGDKNTLIRNHDSRLAELQLRYYGADLQNELNKHVSHVIVHSKDLSRVPALKEMNADRRELFHIVTEDWVFDSINAMAIQTARLYYPN